MRSEGDLSCPLSQTLFSLAFLRAGTGPAVPSRRSRLPFLWGAEHIQRKDLSCRQGTAEREHSPEAGTTRIQRSRNCREVSRRQSGLGLPRDPLGQAQLAAAQEVTDSQPSLETG